MLTSMRSTKNRWEAINKALELDQNLSEAYSVLCENKMYYEYDFAGRKRRVNAPSS